ncbi:MAG: glycoside hydrolase family 18 protein [Alphaproteobacteria bacterium]|nr:glycoside hydrolase family 18 protein [Alphaproteobacteria bacterium]
MLVCATWCNLALANPSADPRVLSPHAEQVATFGREPRAERVPPPRGPMPLPTPGPDLRVYGYLAYWSDDLASVPWDDLTDIALFNAEAQSNGTLANTGRWNIAQDAVAMATPYGVKVHLCVTNFSPSSLTTLLSNASYRNTLISELQGWVATTGADGVNVDFEGLPVGVKTEMVQFVSDLDAAVDEVVLATPSVDWQGSWDYDQLTLHADLFIMGYGYFWNGSSYAGPTDPLYAGAGTVWSGVNSYSLSWTVDDYLTWGANPSRVILGLPLYGISWPTANDQVPTRALGSGSSVVFATAWDRGAQYGREWEPDALSPYTYGGGEQLWYGDEESVRERIDYVRDDAGIAGIGFWALHYDGDDGSFWQMVRDGTTFGGTTTDPGTTTDTGTTTDPGTTDTGDPTGTTEPPTTDLVANAGAPFLAYVGDVVQLSSAGSTGPGALRIEWTQVQGPTVALDDPTAASPKFVVQEPGTLEFQLRVGDDSAWSEPATTWVVVIDPGMAARSRGCGCVNVEGTGWGALLVGLIAAGSRRRYRT